MRGRNEGQQLEVRKDKCTNTLTTVQKDNLLLEKVFIKQATKQGYIPCKIGGGGRFELSRQYNEKGQSNFGRECMSYTNNGEYP